MFCNLVIITLLCVFLFDSLLRLSAVLFPSSLYLFCLRLFFIWSLADVVTSSTTISPLATAHQPHLAAAAAPTAAPTGSDNNNTDKRRHPPPIPPRSSNKHSHQPLRSPADTDADADADAAATSPLLLNGHGEREDGAPEDGIAAAANGDQSLSSLNSSRSNSVPTQRREDGGGSDGEGGGGGGAIVEDEEDDCGITISIPVPQVADRSEPDGCKKKKKGRLRFFSPPESPVVTEEELRRREEKAAAAAKKKAQMKKSMANLRAMTRKMSLAEMAGKKGKKKKQKDKMEEEDSTMTAEGGGGCGVTFSFGGGDDDDLDTADGGGEDRMYPPTMYEAFSRRRMGGAEGEGVMVVVDGEEDSSGAFGGGMGMGAMEDMGGLGGGLSVGGAGGGRMTRSPSTFGELGAQTAQCKQILQAHTTTTPTTIFCLCRSLPPFFWLVESPSPLSLLVPSLRFSLLYLLTSS